MSVLEGGYRIQGRVVSPFGRSVAAHLRGLSAGSAEAWDTARERRQLAAEMAAERAAEEAKAAAAAAAAGAGAGAGAGSHPARPLLSLLLPASTPGVGAASPWHDRGGGLPSAAQTPVTHSLVAARAVALGAAAAAAAPAVDSGSVAPLAQVDATASAPPPALSTAEAAEGALDAEAEGGRRSKRRRSAPSDYAVLDAALRAEDESRRRQALEAAQMPVDAGEQTAPAPPEGGAATAGQ